MIGFFDLKPQKDANTKRCKHIDIILSLFYMKTQVFQTHKKTGRNENYQLMAETAKAFIENESDLIALLSNLSSLIKFHVDNINWAGFYLLKGDELVLGPFQGLPACTRIGKGKGVCGKAVLEARPVVVDDVHKFPGHIACDSASASELVIPFFKGGKVFGVLDLDSPLPGRFSELEADCLGQIAALLTAFLDAA
jgi:GAF domain-containing protein